MQTTERSSDRAHQDLTTTKNSGEQKKNNRIKFDRKPTVSTKSKEEKKIPKSQFFKKKKVSVFPYYRLCTQVNWFKYLTKNEIHSMDIFRNIIILVSKMCI